MKNEIKLSKIKNNFEEKKLIHEKKIKKLSLDSDKAYKIETKKLSNKLKIKMEKLKNESKLITNYYNEQMAKIYYNQGQQQPLYGQQQPQYGQTPPFGQKAPKHIPQSTYGQQPPNQMPQPKNGLTPQSNTKNEDSNQTDIPTFRLIGRGKGINEKEYYAITHAASDALNDKEENLSNGIIKRIKKILVENGWFLQILKV